MSWSRILNSHLSPDACSIPYVWNDELFVVPVAFGELIQITYGARGTGKVDIYIGRCIHLFLVLGCLYCLFMHLISLRGNLFSISAYDVHMVVNPDVFAKFWFLKLHYYQVLKQMPEDVFLYVLYLIMLVLNLLQIHGLAGYIA